MDEIKIGQTRLTAYIIDGIKKEYGLNVDVDDVIYNRLRNTTEKVSITVAVGKKGVTKVTPEAVPTPASTPEPADANSKEAGPDVKVDSTLKSQAPNDKNKEPLF